jgi:trigger factor
MTGEPDPQAEARSETKPSAGLSAVATQESPVRQRVEVRVPASQVRKAFDRAYRDLGKQVRIKGFRPGKAPRPVLERLYGASIAEEIERTLVQQTLPDAIEQVELAPVVPPAIDAAPPEPDADFTYAALVEVKPAIELPELEGLPARKPSVEVTAEEVDAELERLRERNAPVVEEPEETQAETRHILGIDFVGRIDGEPFEGGTGRGVDLELGAGRFIEGFEEQLVGARAGDDRVVEVRFPDEYGEASLAGKEAHFDVHVAEVKRRQLPELDDEFAKDLGDFDSLEALRERIRADLFEMRDNQARAELNKSLVDALIERTPFEVPPGLVEQQLERQLRSAHQRFEGQLDHDALHGQLDRWREEWRPAAEREVREHLLLEAVASQREIAIEEAEVEVQLEKLAASQGTTVAQLRQAVGQETLESVSRRQLADEKALEFLAAAAKVEETSDS